MKNQKADFIVALAQDNEAHFTFTCKGSEVILVIGTLLSRDNKALLEEITSCVEAGGTSLVYLGTMEERALKEQTTFFSRYEVGSEEGVIALLVKTLLSNTDIPQSLRDYFDNLDEGYISAESNLGEEEIEEIQALYEENARVCIILGEDLYNHPQASNIAHLAGLLATFGKAKILLSSNNETISLTKQKKIIPEEIESLKSFDGVVVYRCQALNKEEEGSLIGSLQFQMAAKVQHGDKIQVAINQAMYPRTFVLDESLKGTIALMPSAKDEDVSYRYSVAKIVK